MKYCYSVELATNPFNIIIFNTLIFYTSFQIGKELWNSVIGLKEYFWLGQHFSDSCGIPLQYILFRREYKWENWCLTSCLLASCASTTFFSFFQYWRGKKSWHLIKTLCYSTDINNATYFFWKSQPFHFFISFRRMTYGENKWVTEVHILLYPYFLYPMQGISLTCSIFMTVAIAFERCNAIRKPFNHRYDKYTFWSTITCQKFYKWYQTNLW